MSKQIFFKLILYILVSLQLLIFTFLVPPFQKPDEQPHFEKALLISKGFLFCNQKTNNAVKLEKKYVDFIKTPYLDLMTHGKSNKLPISLFIKDLSLKNQSNKIVYFNVDHLCSFPIVSYLPQAVSLKAISLFNHNPIHYLYFGRFMMGILGYFWFLYLYRKISDDYKLILLFTFALPMTLHQISSFSYDSLHIMFALTFFVLFVNSLKVKALGYWDYFKLFFVLFLFMWSKKIGYETFYFFLFLIPFGKKPIIISSLIFIPLYFLSKFSGLYDLQYSLVSNLIDPVHQLNFLFSNPINIVKVLAFTSIRYFGFYLQSIIGVFGWLEYGLDPLSYFLYCLFFVYLIININPSKKLIFRKNKTFLLFFILLISYIFIVLLTYVFNTVPGTLIAHGVQGRYFIPFLPFIILYIVQIKNNRTLQKILYFLIIFFLIAATFHSVFKRYY